jgi:cobyrinic acid a,c-diamide synthase
MVTLPRLMVAAPGSGHGKTTVATGLMAALRAEGLGVAGFKVGPDFIDPGYHALATGRPGRNLDPVLCGESRLEPLLLHGATVPEPADIAVVEGVMGLFDGQLGAAGYGSTAHVAAVVQTPVVLVLDVSAVSRTAAAIVHGLHTFDPRLRLAGVILNKVGSARHAAEVRSALEATGLPVLGVLPRDASIEVPSRHLGLVTAAEQPEAEETVRLLGTRVAEHLDLTGLLALAHTAPALDAAPWDPGTELGSIGAHPVPAHPRTPRGATGRPVVAIAGGRAFTFRYAETDELLRAAGCEPVVFDPLRDERLPAGTAGLYLGGGFPELHANELSANAALRAEIAGAVAAGLPTVAECAGLLYLSAAVDAAPMTGAVPGEARMSGRLTLGYRTGIANRDHLLGPAGTRVSGHEFHRTVMSEVDPATSAWLLAPASPDVPTPYSKTATAPSGGPPPGSGRLPHGGPAPLHGGPAPLHGGPAPLHGEPVPRHDGYASASLHASYLHVHWAGYPELALRFARAVHAFAARDVSWVPGPVAHPRPEPDLDHHGDAEVGEGLVDLAVNVRVPRPPGWLAEQIVATVDRLAAYPDPTEARRAIAAAHPIPDVDTERGGDHQGRSLAGHEQLPSHSSARRFDESTAHVLPTAGASEAFTLIARAFQPRRAVIVHPQFTEPEAALRAAGRPVERVLLSPERGFRLEPDQVPDDADLVVVGNPTNPTSVLHPRRSLRRLVRPGRLLVVDEAFMDAVPGESDTLLDGAPLDGVLVLRSLTKTWGVAGLRAGYVVGDRTAVAHLRRQQPPWSTSTPALAVIEAALTAPVRARAAEAATELAGWRDLLAAGLTALGLPVVAQSRGPFVLADARTWEFGRAPGSLRLSLRERGFAVRRCDTFPGLSAGWLRIAVREPTTTESLLKTLRAIRAAEGYAG